jgi:hypothetical protein
LRCDKESSRAGILIRSPLDEAPELPAPIFRSNWHLLTIAVTAGVIVCAAVFLLNSMPPRSIAMATGPQGGGYYEIGGQYQELLARSGVELRLVPPAGSVAAGSKIWRRYRAHSACTIC